MLAASAYSPERRLIFTVLQGIMSQKLERFIITVLRIPVLRMVSTQVSLRIVIRVWNYLKGKQDSNISIISVRVRFCVAKN
jgi:hypothetical protein